MRRHLIKKKTSGIKSLKIALVGHVTESYGPMQALPKFLEGKVSEFAVITHPFSYCSIPSSKCLFSKKGKKNEFLGPKYKFKKFFIIHYLGDFLLTLYFFALLARKWDLFIGCDCLNAFSGLVLRSLGVVKKVVFYEHEYTQKRFREEVLNRLFHFINGFAARNSDIIWDSPPNLAEVRKKQRVNLRKIISVPHGVDVEKVKTSLKNNPQTLVYVGHITESKGLQLVVKAMKEVVKSVKGVKVAIVGSGPFEEELKKIIKRNKLDNYFVFWGFTDHNWTLSYLPSCGVGLAPYTPLDRQALMYAEPLKIRDYLTCGLPVIVTHFGSCAEEIEKNHFGLTINYSSSQLAKAIKKLCTDKNFYLRYRRCIKSSYKKRTWDVTFNQAFEKSLQL